MIDGISNQQLLSQMRALSRELGVASPAEQAAAEPAQFASLLRQGIDAVNETQMRAGELARRFDSGATDVDLTEVMINLQKANIGFTAVSEVRNRLVSAYQEVMNMPV
ncbi:MAG: flagellar hook-basal body complex protein FliE [Pseudomonadota bacterium]